MAVRQREYSGRLEVICLGHLYTWMRPEEFRQNPFFYPVRSLQLFNDSC